jgi:signal transduction histidine kinase
MDAFLKLPNHPARILISVAACFAPIVAGAGQAAQSQHPISRLARIFDSQLVKVEDRVAWLDKQIGTYARRVEIPLKSGIGYRGARIDSGGADPTVTLDLGREYPIDRIFLVPSQREFLEDKGIFPNRFTLAVSNDEDFNKSEVVYATGQFPYPPPDGSPVMFQSRKSGRYVRLTVHEGHIREAYDMFGLSEFAVISEDQPVSLGARVITAGALNVKNLWYPKALTDGRTPLGIWHNGFASNDSPGDAVMVGDDGHATTWTLDFGESAAIDRVVLFPYQISRSFNTAILPEKFQIEAAGKRVFEWRNPLPGSSHNTPMVIPLDGLPASEIRVTATMPWIMGDRKLHALSEIEVWSGGRNLAADQLVAREHAGETTPVTQLTDGRSSEYRIIPMGHWLHQLRERARHERELEDLRGVQQQMASNSELNATWGSAVILGLTFMIPVFIVERRRLMSREQLDTIRKRIASDLHDDIGSNLGSISLIARTARKDLVRLQGPEEIAEDLDEVETIARESSLAMRDIVWLLEKRQDTVGDLLQRMRETATRLMREVECTMECESSRTAAKLSLDGKRHLFLFFKEAVHNVLKHSRATRVSIRLWDEGDKLAMEIRDNGAGLPTDERGQTVTVRKLDDRARVLQGALSITSPEDGGTCVRLLVHRSNLNQQTSQS